MLEPKDHRVQLVILVWQVQQDTRETRDHKDLRGTKEIMASLERGVVQEIQAILVLMASLERMD